MSTDDKPNADETRRRAWVDAVIAGRTDLGLDAWSAGLQVYDVTVTKTASNCRTFRVSAHGEEDAKRLSIDRAIDLGIDLTATLNTKYQAEICKPRCLSSLDLLQMLQTCSAPEKTLLLRDPAGRSWVCRDFRLNREDGVVTGILVLGGAGGPTKVGPFRRWLLRSMGPDRHTLRVWFESCIAPTVVTSWHETDDEVVLSTRFENE